VTNTTGGTTPAGWYPVSAGSTQLRWWDGTQWTDHVHDQAIAGAAAEYGQVLKAPAGTNPNTVWIWILAVMPVLGLIVLPFFDSTSMFRNALANPSSPSATLRSELAIYSSPFFLISLGVGFVEYVLYVLFAYFDSRQLKALGVPKPFPWALAFIPSGYGYLVYMIGRFVIVKRRTGTGLTPLWVWIAVYVVVFIISIVWVVSVFANMTTLIQNSVQ
jgi:hypothetical protein